MMSEQYSVFSHQYSVNFGTRASRPQKEGGQDVRAPKLTENWLLLTALLCSSLLLSCKTAESESVKFSTVHIIRRIPHSTQSFTQGLVYHDGMLYESTGLYGQSTLQKIDAGTGVVQETRPITMVFAEGLAKWNDRLIQLTWKRETAFVYSVSDFSQTGMLHYEGEGWGLTADEQHLIMSNGSDQIVFRDPETFAPTRSISVTYHGKPVHQVNELEYINGVIYANVWYEDVILQIDPEQGNIVGMIDASPLRTLLPELGRDEVLNGIAYNYHSDTLYLTGKNWPAIFEVTLIDDQQP